MPNNMRLMFSPSVAESDTLPGVEFMYLKI